LILRRITVSVTTHTTEEVILPDPVVSPPWGPPSSCSEDGCYEDSPSTEVDEFPDVEEEALQEDDVELVDDEGSYRFETVSNFMEM
jgi:hypothetical protein